MLLFPEQKRKISIESWLSHISILKVQPLCRHGCLQERTWSSDLYKTPRPVMFAFTGLDWSLRRTTKTWRGECLAMIWGMEKFHYFLYGKQFYTWDWHDQKAISLLYYKKHMVEISPRIQRLIMRSFPYQPFWCPIQERKRNTSGRCLE